MQHHPWILPWGVPLQKVVAVPIHPAAAHHPGIPQPLHPHHHHQHPPHPATVHVPAGVLGLPPTTLAALRTFVTAPQAATVPATPRPRKVGRVKCFVKWRDWILSYVGFRPVPKMLILPNAVVTICTTCFALLSFRNEVPLRFFCSGKWTVRMKSWIQGG